MAKGKGQTRRLSIYRTFLVAVLLLLPFLTASDLNAADPPKKVLILMPDDPYLPAITVVNEAIRATLRKGSPGHIQFYYEALESSRIPNEKYESEFVSMLRQKYTGEKIDLSIAISPPALRFLVKHRASIFSATPIVYIVPNPSRIAGLDLGTFATGVIGETELSPTLDLALALQPETKRVVVVAGSSPLDQSRLEAARKDFAAYEDRVEFVYLTDKSMEEFQKEVAALAPGTIVFYSSLGVDSVGGSYSAPESGAILSTASSVPVYGTSQLLLGRGIVGGDLIEYEALGVGAAEIGLRVLAGENPGAIPVKKFESVPMFDWNQLRRWGISEEALPAGSIVRFKDPTFWDQYKWQAAAVLTFIILESLLILLLLFLREKRKEAEIESLRFAALAQAEHQRLDEVVSNVPGIVWESRIEPGTNRRKTQFVSGYVENMLGYSLEEWHAVPSFLYTIIVEQDRERVARTFDEIFESGKESVIQYRWMTKDCRVIWAEAHVAVINDDNSKPIGLRGVTMDITAGKKAEEKLRERESELTEAQRLAQVGSWEWDSVTDAVTWSDEVYRIYGLDSSQPAVPFQEQRDLVVSESWERLQSEVAITLKTGEPYEVEIELVRADGGRAWGSSRGEIVPNSESLKLRGTLQDITARKKAEEAIRESEERFRNIANNAPVMIWMADENANITFADQSWVDFTGFTQEQLLGEGWMDALHEDDRLPSTEVYMPAIERREPFALEYRVRRFDGEYRWLYSSGVPRFNGIGDFLGYIGSDVDITEMKVAADAVGESESRFRNIADSAPVLIWMSDVSPLITFVNKYCVDFTGVSEERLKGEDWLAVIHPDDVQRCVNIYTAAYERREPFVYEFRIRGRDGVYKWFYSTSAPRFGADGEFLGYVGTCVDIDDRKKVEDSLQLALSEISQLKNSLAEENIYLREEIKLIHNFGEMIGESEALKYVQFKIEQVAPTSATVLICGETGTGKELVARALHSAGLRKHKPFVKVNCAALAANFIESELFGHEKGSFTGASSKRIGRFELAQGGTIFLDEIGELPMDLQVKLLRILQEGEFERLGSSRTMKIDVRIIAATNRDLQAEVQKGKFREDLMFRLNVFPITVPPLRERAGDIPLLVNYFARRFSKQLGKSITAVSPAALRTLSAHSWPGNIRELANVIERSVIGTNGETLKTVEVFEKTADLNGHASANETLESMERKHIAHILGSTGWRIEGESGAARILGLNPSTLRTRMSKLGISRRLDQTNGSR